VGKLKPKYAILRWLLEKQVVPTGEDIASVKSLAERLKGLTDAETLNNILEWQERNIAYWWERYYLVPLLIFISNTLILLGLPPLALLRSILFTIFTALSLGASLSITIYLFLTHNPELIKLMFKFSLPLSKMLEYRMGVCRDYAKLTASLLVNLYPSSKIYFFAIPRHVAAGIRLGNKIYVLDRRLPILEPEAWLTIQGVRKAEMFELINKDGNLSIRLAGEISLCQRQPSIFNIKNMFKEIVSEVEKAVKEGRDTASIVLKNAASLFDIDDAIIKESLLRKVRIILQNEFASKASKLRETILFKKGNDIILELRPA